MTRICRYAGATDRGRRTTINEDRWSAEPALGLYLVSDGLGGRVAGELAATLVAETLPKLVARGLSGSRKPPPASVASVLRSAICELSETLVSETRNELGLEGMAATVVALLVRPECAMVAHLGDSRAYLQRDQRLVQLTRDHTILQMLIDQGQTAWDEHERTAAGHQLTRFVGMPPPVMPEINSLELSEGDRVLLCTDGLHEMLTEVQLRDFLHARTDLEPLCERLIAAANAAGGEDNSTVVVVEVGPHVTDFSRA